jgi:Zn-dependent protease
VLIVIELARAGIGSRDGEDHLPLGISWTAVALAFLFVSTLVHECGHALATRMLGGRTPVVLLWPLGGLARGRLRDAENWKSELLATIGGPCAGVVIFAVLALALWLAGAPREAFAPAMLDPLAVSNGLIATAGSWWLTALFLWQWTNALVLLANLIPIFPLDGAYVVQGVLAQRMGYVRAMRLAAQLGVVFSVLLGLIAMLAGVGAWSGYGLALAFFGGFVCVGSVKRLDFTESELDVSGLDEDEDNAVIGRIGAKPGQQKRDAQSARVDAILEKIQRSGMKSLNFRERRLLKKITRNKQGD